MEIAVIEDQKEILGPPEDPVLPGFQDNADLEEMEEIGAPPGEKVNEVSVVFLDNQEATDHIVHAHVETILLVFHVKRNIKILFYKSLKKYVTISLL